MYGVYVPFGQDVDGGGVDMVEFLTYMLVQINGLSKEKDIDPWIKVREVGYGIDYALL